MNAQLKKAKCCDAQTTLEKARNLYGTTPRYIPYPPAPITNVRTSSGLVAYEMMSTAKVCPPVVRTLPTRESVRIRLVIQKSLDCEVDPYNYQRFFPVPCPPIGADYLNASMPKASIKCQLPNQPDFPIFPA